MSGLYQKRRKRPELNLVPLIDVLVMLIFFAFVTMQFKQATTMNLTLQGSGRPRLGKRVVVYVYGLGRVEGFVTRCFEGGFAIDLEEGRSRASRMIRDLVDLDDE